MLTRCDTCGRPLGETLYEVKQQGRVSILCGRCILRYRPFIIRAVFIAIFVGTFLTLVNQGNVILDGDFPSSLYWKIPLTYSVPFCVSNVSSILAARTRLSPV